MKLLSRSLYQALKLSFRPDQTAKTPETVTSPFMQNVTALSASSVNSNTTEGSQHAIASAQGTSNPSSISPPPSSGCVECQQNLSQSISIASVCAEKTIVKRKSETLFPPVSWLQEKISHNKLSEHRNRLHAKTLDGKEVVIEAQIPESRDWVRFRLRIKSDDEIRSFSGSLIPGHGLSYRAGIALVRNGVPIEHIVTIKS